MAEELRKMAALLREEDAHVKAEKAEKCANILRASTGLAILKRKLGVR